MRRSSCQAELGFKSMLCGILIQRAARPMVSVSRGEKGEQTEYRERQIML